MSFHVKEDQISKLIIDKGDKLLFKKIYGDIFDKTIDCCYWKNQSGGVL